MTQVVPLNRHDLVMVCGSETSRTGDEIWLEGYDLRGPRSATSTAIPYGVWPDRADGGLCRAPRKALPEVSGHQNGLMMVSAHPSPSLLLTCQNYQ